LTSLPRSTRLEAEVPDTARHLEFASRHYGDPVVARWHWPDHLGGARTPAQVSKLLEAERTHQERHGYALWWWRERESGELIGHIGLNRTEVEGEPVTEVGWSVRPDRWGEGLATEAAGASLSWGFEVAELDQIVSFTMVENLASRRVMEKIGLAYVREFDRFGFDHVLYAARRS